MMKLTAGWKKGAGRERDYFAIKKWLDEKCLSLSQIARDVGTHPTLASQVIRGHTNSRKVLRRFLELGCPADILSLPKDMKEAVDA